jgi:hypothetical protein
MIVLYLGNKHFTSRYKQYFVLIRFVQVPSDSNGAINSSFINTIFLQNLYIKSMLLNISSFYSWSKTSKYSHCVRYFVMLSSLSYQKRRGLTNEGGGCFSFTATFLKVVFHLSNIGPPVCSS